jgi:putative transposase
MSHSRVRLLAHIVFGTKSRAQLIAGDLKDELHAYQAKVLRECESPALAIGGTEDHVHILCDLSRSRALCDVVEEVKKRSSKWIKTKGANYANFAWQTGYGAFSVGVGESNVESVRRYIENQERHHAGKTFGEEYREREDRSGGRGD